VAAQATESGGSGHVHGPTHTHCENCGAELQGPFCHKCGQHDFEFHRSFGHVFMEALENFFHFDAKFFRNIVTLLFRPGVLTAEFNAGKRASQMPPFRLYLFVSVLFFFLSFVGRSSSSLLDEERAKAGHATQDAITSSREQAPNERPAGSTERERQHAPAQRAHDSASPHAAPQSATMPGSFNIRLSEANDTAFERYLTERGQHALAHPEELKESFIHALPKMLLVCLPLFALFTRVLFRKSGQVYLQHLVLALHFHTFIYLFLLVRSGWVWLGSFAYVGGLISFAAGVWLAAYPFLMFRRLFGTSWWGTIWRTLLLTASYWFLLCLAFVSTIMLIFVML